MSVDPASATPRRVNLKPSFWGPSAWKFLYTVALGYPSDPTPQEKQAAANLLESLHFLLPCANCRQNVSRELENAPYNDALRNQENFTNYVYMIESSVARRLGKSDFPTLQERLQQIYNQIETSIPAPTASRRRAVRLKKNAGNLSASDNNDSDSGLSVGAFVGVILAAVVVGALVGWGVTFGVMKRKQAPAPQFSQSQFTSY